MTPVVNARLSPAVPPTRRSVAEMRLVMAKTCWTAAER